MEKTFFLSLLIVLLTGCTTTPASSPNIYPDYAHDNYWSSYRESFDKFESMLRIGMSVTEIENLIKDTIQSYTAYTQDTKNVSAMGISILRKIHTDNGDYYLYFFNDKLTSWTK